MSPLTSQWPSPVQKVYDDDTEMSCECQSTFVAVLQINKLSYWPRHTVKVGLGERKRKP